MRCAKRFSTGLSLRKAKEIKGLGDFWAPVSEVSVFCPTFIYYVFLPL